MTGTPPWPQAVWVAGVLGVLSVPLCLFPAPILDRLSLDPDTYQKATDYLQATAFGLPGAALFQALRCHVQGISKDKHWRKGVRQTAISNLAISVGAPGCH